MTTLRLKPKSRRFFQPSGCGWLIKEFFAGSVTYGYFVVNSTIGALPLDIPRYLRETLCKISAMDNTTTSDTNRARNEKLHIDPNNVSSTYQRYNARTSYKANGYRDHSLDAYFVTLQWLGRVEQSKFQSNYPPGQPRKYCRLTFIGKVSTDSACANLFAALYKGY